MIQDRHEHPVVQVRAYQRAGRCHDGDHQQVGELAVVQQHRLVREHRDRGVGRNRVEEQQVVAVAVVLDEHQDEGDRANGQHERAQQVDVEREAGVLDGERRRAGRRGNNLVG